MRVLARVLITPALILLGCSDRDPEIFAAATAVQSMVAGNGSSLNGSSLNGSSLNGSSLNGSSLNGVSLNGSSLNGSSLNGALLDGSELVALRGDGNVLRGSDITGAQFTGFLSDGRTIPLRVSSVSSDNEVYIYEVYYETDQGWLPLCADSGGDAEKAIALTGRWDDRGAKIAEGEVFTFACPRGALFKCVELGYRPWEMEDDVPLGDYHQACTRMLRADYCGDGESWTVDGTLVNLYDARGIQSDETDWIFEAEWGPSGARCLRNVAFLRANLRNKLPPCIAHLFSPFCGENGFASGALLMTEYLQPGGDGGGDDD